nr:RecName: Full=Kunitz-type serine protease inhibitor homolog T1-2 B chain; AltName: Full=Neurotoxin T1-2 B chain [Bungarus candidus]
RQRHPDCDKPPDTGN